MDNELHVGDKSVIELKYILRLDQPDGEVAEVMDEQWPLKFLFGAGTMLPEFERQLEGLKEGQLFNFKVEAKDGYGHHDPSKVIQVFKEDIEENHRYPIDNYELGDYIQVKTENGEPIAGKISELKDQYLLVDCNHAMAGRDLYFEGQILHIRPASRDEVSQGRYIEEDGLRRQHPFNPW